MDRTIIFIIITITFCELTFAQNVEYSYTDSLFSCNYSIKNGMLDGSYESFYINGKKKSEGQFFQNNRIGKWIVWDSSGNKRAVRNYENNFFFKKIQPAFPKDKSIELLNYLPLNPERNSDSYFDFWPIKEKDAFYSIKYLGIISIEKYENLFPTKEIVELLFENKKNEDFATYYIFENYNQHEFDLKTIENKILIAFKTKKEIIYDLNRQLSESRLVFLAPVILDTITGQINDYNWFYYPQIHSYFADLKLEITTDIIDIKNVSDVFFWNSYPEQLLMKQDYLNRLEIKDIPTNAYTNKEEMENISLNWDKNIFSEIEQEHNIWMYFTKVPKNKK